MSAWMEKVNELFTEFYNTIADAGIKNTLGFKLTVYQRGLPAQIETSMCPAVAIVRDRLSNRQIELDQPAVIPPVILTVMLAFSDFSEIDLDDADAKTDDLITKTITALEANPSLKGLSKGIWITEIVFDCDRRSGIWFSEPTVQCMIEGTNL